MKINGLRPVYQKIKGAKLIFEVEIIFYEVTNQKKLKKRLFFHLKYHHISMNKGRTIIFFAGIFFFNLFNLILNQNNE